MNAYETQHIPYAIEYALWVRDECLSAARYVALHGTLPDALSHRAYVRIVNDSAWFSWCVREETRRVRK